MGCKQMEYEALLRNLTAIVLKRVQVIKYLMCSIPGTTYGSLHSNRSDN